MFTVVKLAYAFLSDTSVQTPAMVNFAPVEELIDTPAPMVMAAANSRVRG